MSCTPSIVTCAHALSSKWQDVSTWKYVLWNYLKIHKYVGSECACTHAARLVKNIIWPNEFPNSPDARSFCAKKFLFQLLSPLFGDLVQCASNQSSTYAALKNCLMFASQSPPAYLCLLAIASVSAPPRHFLDIFGNLPVNFKCAKIILTYICNIYSLVQHEIIRARRSVTKC